MVATLEISNKFEGMEIGIYDVNNNSIKCGHRILITERHDAYIEYYTQDGWGRKIKLDRADVREIPAKINHWKGYIFYSTKFCAFRVKFLDRWPDEDGVYMFKEIEII